MPYNDSCRQLPRSSPAAYPGFVVQSPESSLTATTRRAVWPRLVIRMVMLVCSTCVLIAGIISAGFNTNPRRPQGAAAPDAAMISIGREVHVGKSAFTVLAVYSEPMVGTASAHGKFVVVSLTVRNTGDEPGSYLATQMLIDVAGTRFAPDATAGASINDAMVMHLNPGFELNIKVPFDVPVGATPAILEVHDSSVSSVAQIRLN